MCHYPASNPCQSDASCHAMATQQAVIKLSLFFKIYLSIHLQRDIDLARVGDCVLSHKLGGWLIRLHVA